ncbi:immunoglobulin-binding protein 1-like protein, partial [Dinothrombium tinctorium]
MGESIVYHFDRISPYSHSDICSQRNVEDGISLLEDCTRIINDLQLYSINETLDDLSNASLKYLIIPALLGSFTLKLTSHKRTDILQTARVYFKDYLKRLKSYEITDLELEGSDDSSHEDDDEVRKKRDDITSKASKISLEEAAKNRNEKIRRYKQQKEIDEKLENFEKLIESKSSSDIDDEIIREFYLSLIQKWIYIAVDELNAIDSESKILAQMKDFGSKPPQNPVKSRKTPLKTFIIARNETQKRVFGLGYPGVPTMTVDEFINKKVEEGSLSVTSA